MTSCQAFAHWLDAGMPGPEGRDHAATCPRCAPLLAAALAVEDLLAADSARAPTGFAAAVMRRVTASEPALTRAPLWLPPLLPLWLRAAMEPAAVLAMGLAGLVLWNVDWPGAVVVGVRTFGAAAAEWASPAKPNTQLGLEIAGILFAVIASLPLMRWAERFAGRLARVTGPGSARA